MGIVARFSTFRWYIPEYLGNRARAKADPTYEPFELELKVPTWVEQRRLYESGPASVDAQREYLAAHVGRIRGLELEDGTKLVHGRQLLEYADRLDWSLFQELNIAIGNQANLEEGLRGNFSGPPGSGASTPESAGPAAPAAPAASTA